MLAVMAFISALGVEIRLHFQLVMFGLGRGDGDVQALDPRPFPGPTREAMRRGSRIGFRSEEHTSELQSLMRISYAVFCLKKKTHQENLHNIDVQHQNDTYDVQQPYY